MWPLRKLGFGADLGAEKFIDIKCHYAGLYPDAVVVVATIRALKMHGGVAKTDLGKENVKALSDGFSNLAKQVENMRSYGLPVLVAINKFATDTPAEIDMLLQKCASYGVEVALNESWEKGGEGGLDMARKLARMLEEQAPKKVELYDVNDTIPNKLKAIVTKIYGGDGVTFTPNAKKQIKQLEEWGLDKLPVCVAKTQYSLSDNPALLGGSQRVQDQCTGCPCIQRCRLHRLPDQQHHGDARSAQTSGRSQYGYRQQRKDYWFVLIQEGYSPWN